MVSYISTQTPDISLPVLVTPDSNGSRHLHPSRLFRLHTTPPCASASFPHARTHEELQAHDGGLQRFGDMYVGALHPVGFVARLVAGFIRGWTWLIFLSLILFGQC